MVKETNLEGRIVYVCEKCGWLYNDKSIADDCQSWCNKHKICNLKFVKYAIKLGEVKNEEI